MYTTLQVALHSWAFNGSTCSICRHGSQCEHSNHINHREGNDTGTDFTVSEFTEWVASLAECEYYMWMRRNSLWASESSWKSDYLRQSFIIFISKENLLYQLCMFLTISSNLNYSPLISCVMTLYHMGGRSPALQAVGRIPPIQNTEHWHSQAAAVTIHCLLVTLNLLSEIAVMELFSRSVNSDPSSK